MYSLKDIYRVGLVNMVGGGLALVIGTAVWIFVSPKTDPLELVINALFAYIIFASAWFALRLPITLPLYNNIVQGLDSNKIELVRAKEKPQPATKMGSPYLVYERNRLIVAIVLVAAATLVLGETITVSLGGFAGGWFTGGGISRIFFARRLSGKEIELGRTYYFNNAELGPNTEVTYYAPPSAAEKTIAEPEHLPGLVELKKVSRPARSKRKR